MSNAQQLQSLIRRRYPTPAYRPNPQPGLWKER